MFLTTIAANTSNWFSGLNLNWSEPSWDLFIILFFVIAALLYGMSLGRDRIIVILISIYMALAVVNAAPYINTLGKEINQMFVLKITSFVAIFVALFFFLSRSALLATVASSDAKGKWWQVIIFSFLHVGLLISITLSFLPASATKHLAPFTQNVFVSDLARFLWIIAPILLMVLLKGGASDKKKFKYDI